MKTQDVLHVIRLGKFMNHTWIRPERLLNSLYSYSF